MNNHSSRIKKLIAITLVFVVAILYFLFEPVQYKYYPKCPLHYMTGLKCPLCGLQQMIYSFLHFQFENAFFANPFLFCLLIYLLPLFYFNLFNEKNKYPAIYKALYGNKAVVVIIIAGFLFGVVRNIL